jgi:hypothetical protein
MHVSFRVREHDFPTAALFAARQVRGEQLLQCVPFCSRSHDVYALLDGAASDWNVA